MLCSLYDLIEYVCTLPERNSLDSTSWFCTSHAPSIVCTVSQKCAYSEMHISHNTTWTSK